MESEEIRESSGRQEWVFEPPSRAFMEEKKRREEGAVAVVFAAAGLCLTDRLLGNRGAATPIFLPSA